MASSKRSHWVFESNQSGSHAEGVALLAARYHGAEEGRGNGPAGTSYALSVYDDDDGLLPWDRIESEIQTFRDHAEANPTTGFRILPGGQPRPDDIHARFAELFRNAPANCELPGRWLEILGHLKSVRVILLDANVLVRPTDERTRALDQFFAANEALWETEFVEIVSFGPAMTLVSNDKYARARGYRHRILDVDTIRYGDDAEEVRELLSVAYATKFVCINDPDGTSTSQQIGAIRIAASAGLEIDAVLVEE